MNLPDFSPFFELAGRSPTRRKSLVRLMIVHLVCIGIVTLLGISAHSHRIDLPIQVRMATPRLVEWLGWTLLIAGIIEGALLLGWRLTQLPKSRALEPLLLSPAPAWQTLLGEQLVGLTQLAFVSLSSVPILLLLIGCRWLDPWEAAAIVALGFAWGSVVGFGLAWWAFEPDWTRRIGERIVLTCIAAFLLFFGIFSEHSRIWLSYLPWELGRHIERWLFWSHQNNPFDLVHRIGRGSEPLGADVVWMLLSTLIVAIVFIARSSLRLKGHYLERNYRPRVDVGNQNRPAVGDRPITWWAVKRVNEYPGRINLYLAVGAAFLYSLYLVVGDQNWPATFGRQIFRIYELTGGVAGFSTVLVLLAAVPAAYQYGLWDSSIPERCKRLETFLPTKLNVTDYLLASIQASWNRGRGYFITAMLLWLAACAGGKMSPESVILATVSGLTLMLLYFAIAFRTFAGGRGNTTLGFVLVVVLPLLAWLLGGNGLQSLARITPPGLVYFASSSGEATAILFPWLFAMLAISAILIWQACKEFDEEIRAWYDRNLGRIA